MSHVGIDLGTTNSAVCSFDGVQVRLHKSPEQLDVTPSAIYVDRRGNQYVGMRAALNAARSPDNAAVLFKRLMGTSTPVRLPAVGLTLTPEACSAEILRVLWGYLPHEIREDPETGTVITVPAAFNQMQKDATMAAAEAAGIGRVALMQEPVAAVMSVVREHPADGLFVVYDLGGGTLDVAVAECIAGKVGLLAHGGIAMCGGRDFDRMLLDEVVAPWLRSNFDLPEDFPTQARFRSLARMATWAAERAKIELSSREEAVISLSDAELAVRDLAGDEIHLDITVTRPQLDALIAARVDESIEATRRTLAKAGLSPRDVERLVFVGGPTQYRPLRERVAAELGIAGATEVDPMTAVAQGAAVFAESIDWSSRNRGRKPTRAALRSDGPVDVSFGYAARTPDSRTRLVARVGVQAPAGLTLQVDSLDTGWTSGRVALADGTTVDLGLPRPGDNTFKVFVFGPGGGPVRLAQDRMVITRTAALIDAIPASHSICVEVLDRLGGRATLDRLVREGDPLPARGRRTYKAAETLRAGSPGAIRIKLWEGEIADPIDDNRLVGTLRIDGQDFEHGVITAGADIVCAYEVLDSGHIVMEVQVPSIGMAFPSGRSFYSRQEGQVDYSQAGPLVAAEAEAARERLGAMQRRVADPRLARARLLLEVPQAVRQGTADAEAAKQAMDDIQEARRLMAQVRRDHLPVIRQVELDQLVAEFDARLRRWAQPTEAAMFDALVRTAQRAIDHRDDDFDRHAGELRAQGFQVQWRQDWYVVDCFRAFAATPHEFSDPTAYAQLVPRGERAVAAGDMTALRSVVAELHAIRRRSTTEVDLLATANIVRT